MLANDAPAAQRRLQQYVDANPKSSEAWLLLAQTRQGVKAPAQEVAGLIEKAVLADPASKEARLALANFWFEQRDYGKAANAAQEALARLPDSPEFLEVLGRSFRGSGDTNQAQATYLKWASMRPSDPEPLFRAAEIMVSVKDMESAARTLRKAVEIKPEYVPAQQGLARLNLLSGRGDEARAIARQVQAQKSTQGAGYTIEGDIEAASKNWSEAITAYRKGLKVAASTNLAIKLYSVLVTSKQTHEAEQFAASWLKDYPGDLVFRLYLSESLLVRGDFADAEKQMLTILEKRPEDAGVLNNLAYVSMRLKRPKAVEYAERAVKLEPGKAAFIDTLGMVLADSGQTGRAVEVLSRAVQLAPDDHGIRFNYAKALVADGKKDAARRELEVLAKLGNKFPAQADVTKLQASL
jgi:putative PEP-CTERM system TPR-repeat lipoprotein